MISDVIGEEIVKFAKRIIEIMCHPECEVIKQMKFNWDLIEVKDGKCFSISNRDFIECPIDLKGIGLIPQGHLHPTTIQARTLPLRISKNQLKTPFRTWQHEQHS